MGERRSPAFPLENITVAILTCNRTKEPLTIAERDFEMLALLENIPNHNVHILRKIASWATRRTLGKARNFWGKPECTPLCWPSDIPFVKISRKLERKALILILESYKKFHSKKDECNSPICRDRSPTHSLTKEPDSRDNDEDVTSPSQQPECTSLAILSEVVPLSNANTFLSDISINAFAEWQATINSLIHSQKET